MYAIHTGGSRRETVNSIAGSDVRSAVRAGPFGAGMRQTADESPLAVQAPPVKAASEPVGRRVCGHASGLRSATATTTDLRSNG